MPFDPPAIPGFQFSGGKLRIISPESEMIVTGWPEPNAIRKTTRRPGWYSFTPEFRLVRPYRSSRARKTAAPASQPTSQLDFNFLEAATSPKPSSLLPLAKQRKKAFDGFRFSLPKPVAASLEPFVSHQWPLLNLLRYDESALELAGQNPALAFLLAQRMNGDRELIRTLNCGSMRQRDILDSLGLPSSPGAVKLFRKIKPTSINGDNSRVLIAAIRAELNRQKPRLAHLKSINAGVLEILNHPQASGAASQTLLAEVANDPGENHRARIVHLITNTLRMNFELHPHHETPSFPNIRRLRQIHDQLAENYRRRLRQLNEVRKVDSRRFEMPPLTGIPGKIEPITSPEALVEEGEEQGNCVASYAGKVECGETFIYKVLEPSRSTLSIVKNPDGHWKIGELEGKFNTEVCSWTEDFVEAWLERHRISV